MEAWPSLISGSAPMQGFLSAPQSPHFLFGFMKKEKSWGWTLRRHIIGFVETKRKYVSSPRTGRLHIEGRQLIYHYQSFGHWGITCNTLYLQGFQLSSVKTSEATSPSQTPHVCWSENAGSICRPCRGLPVTFLSRLRGQVATPSDEQWLLRCRRCSSDHHTHARCC